MAPGDGRQEMEGLGDLLFKQDRLALFEGIELQCNDLLRQCAATGSAKSSGFVRAVAQLVSQRIKSVPNAFIRAYVKPIEEAPGGIDDECAAWLRKKREQVWLNLGGEIRGWTSSLCQSSGYSAAEVHPAVQEIDSEFCRLGLRADDHIEIARLSWRHSGPARSAAAIPVGQYTFHAEVERVSARLLAEGNFRQAVLDAYIHLISAVKDRTQSTKDGDSLMNDAFAPDNRVPLIRFNALATQDEKDEQRGYWYLFKGIVGLRNRKAHRVVPFEDPQRAHEYLALASLLFRLLEESDDRLDTESTGAAARQV